MGARGILIVLLVASLARAEDVGHATRHQIAERHVSLAERLSKKHPREAFEELLLALEMDPNDHEARTRLGYKKDANHVWQGAPQVPAASGGQMDQKLAQERDHVRKDSADKLVLLAKQLKEDRKPDDARLIAGLALEEEPEDKRAREILGHTKRGDAWASARELKIREAFAKALQAAKGGEAKAGPDDEAFGKLCGLGAMDRKESAHGIIYWTRAARDVEADALLRTAETAWLAHRYFMSGDDAGFSVEGEPKRTATGREPPPYRPTWLIVADEEHAKFIESSLPDKQQHDFAKHLVGWAQWHKLPAGPILLNEGHFIPPVRPEWVAGCMADFLTSNPLQERARLIPDFFQEGVKRFFSGHVSLRAEIFYASTGSSTSNRAFKAGTFDTLRAHARVALQQAPEGELRALLAKKTNDFDQLDSAVALAFIDFLLAQKRAELAAFFTELKESETATATLERVLKKSLEEVERDFREFVREEY